MVVVCVYVYVQHLTSRVIACGTNKVTYSAADKSQEYCGDFSECAPFKSYGVICLPLLQRLVDPYSNSRGF